jgi:hypothetical protein
MSRAARDAGDSKKSDNSDRSSFMTRSTTVLAALVFFSGFVLTLVSQSVYPTGTTIYDPARAWNGYTVLSPLNTQAAIVIDMNG